MKPMKVEFGSKELSLVLDGKATVDIEKRLGKSMIGIMMGGNGEFRIPKLGEMLTILHTANQKANIKMAEMPELYDEYVKNGGTIMNLFEVIQKLMEEAGFFGSKESAENSDLIGENSEETEESLI